MNSGSVDALRHARFSGYPEVRPGSEDFHKIDYSLQTQLGNTELSTKKIWMVTTPKLNKKYQEFQQEGDYLTELTSLVPTEDLDDINHIEKVLERGFIIQPPGGLLFPCGYFPLKKNQGLIYEALVCKISVSKTVVCPNSEITPDLIREYHKENLYDSILCEEDSKQKEKTPYSYNYIILKGAQILPCYIVHFEINERKVPKCFVCQKKDATLYCKNDEIDLCEDCDEDMHPPGKKISQNHQRVALNLKPLKCDPCEKHPNNLKELFCVKCREELCISCKLVGDHSIGELADHSVWPLNDCFDNLRQSKENFTPQIKEMKNKINSTLLTLASRSINLKEQFNQLEANIKQIYDDA